MTIAHPPSVEGVTGPSSGAPSNLAYRPCGEKVSENAAKHSLTTAGDGRQ